MKSRNKLYLVLSLVLVSIILVFRLYYIDKVELVPDECYYWEWSRRLDYCYLDQGPVLGFVIYLTTKLFGESTEFSVRFGAIFCGLLTTVVGYTLTKKVFGNLFAAFVSIILFHLAVPFTSVGSMLITHDNVAMVFWAISCYIFYKIILLYHSNKLQLFWWIILGISTGLTIMSKYTGVLFFLCVISYLVCDKNMCHCLFSKEIFLYVVVSIAICLPAIIWNIQHGFPTYKYLTGPVVLKPFNSISIINAVKYIFIQAGLSNFFIFFIYLKNILFNKKMYEGKFSPGIKWLIFCSLPVLLFFLLFSIFAEFQENWPAPYYFGYVVLLSGVIGDNKNKPPAFKLYTLGSIIFGFIIICAIFIHLVHPIIKSITLGDDKIRHGRTLCKELTSILNEFQQQNKKIFLLTNYYGIAAKVAFYLQDQPEISCVDTGAPLRQYAMWTNFNNLKNQDALYIKQTAEIEPIVERMFNKLEHYKTIKIPIRTDIKTEQEFWIYYCHKLKNEREN